MNTFNLSFEELKNYVFCLKYFVRPLCNVLHVPYSFQTTERITLWPPQEWHLDRVSWWSQGQSTLHIGDRWVSSLLSLISPFSIHEPVLTKNISQFPYLGPWSDSTAYNQENTRLPSVDLKKEITPNTTTQKTIFAFIPIPGTWWCANLHHLWKIWQTSLRVTPLHTSHLKQPGEAFVGSIQIHYVKERRHWSGSWHCSCCYREPRMIHSEYDMGRSHDFTEWKVNILLWSN